MKKIAWMGLLFVMTISLIFTLVGESGSYSYFKDVEKSQGNTLQAGTWKVDQTIIFDNPGDKTFGSAPFALSASASSGLPVIFSVVSGPATLGSSNLTLTGAGILTVKASQGGNDSYNAAPDVEQTFNVAKATPTITWANPADITVGTALGDTQLNATTSVEGSFVYTPAVETVLDVGAEQTLSVEFTPDDTANYKNASATVTINVNTPLSSAKEITSFSFAGLGDGVITETSIAVTVPFGTDVTALVPTIVITGVSVNPASDVAQNFTNPVTYTVTAEDNSTQDYVVTVIVNEASDTTPPVITLLGDNSVNLTVGASYEDAGATATDDVDGDITENIVVVNPVDVNAADTYIITYNVSDAAGNSATEVTRTVVVSMLPDTTPPTLTEVTPVSTLTNDNTPDYTFNSDEAGTIAYAGGCTSATTEAVAGNNTVTFDTFADGIYDSCTIIVTDAAGNPSTALNVSTFTIDTTLPVITLLGEDPVNLYIGDIYEDAGATATDDVDGDITANIVVGGDIVNTNVVGPYTISYNATDTAGNPATEITRTVNVQ